MNRLVLSLTMAALVACGGGAPPVRSVPGQGAIAVQVDPNPIRATHISGNTYDFPFEVIVRETGGRPVNVTRVNATVKGFGGMTFANETWDAERIRAMGYSTSVAANGELRYRFAPRKDVPDERLFGGVTAQLTVEAVDDGASATSASTAVTVTR